MKSPQKSTIIFVHGAWHWGGCFQKVSTLLSAQGHPTLLPDLKSHGFDPATYDQVADIADYTASIATLLGNATEPVVLVGHSMGGVALTYLGEKYPEKISKLIYLTAFMTPSEKSVNNYLFSDGYKNDPDAKDLFDIVAGSPDKKGVTLNTHDAAKVRSSFYGDCSEHDAAVAARNVIPTNTTAPYVALTVTTPSRFGAIPRVYIECTKDRALPLSQQRQMQADVPGAKIVTLESGHSPFFSHPDHLAEIIIQEAR
ncbi:alpha/beta fold hydrolase [Caballeronia sp. dw_276]|uniref:alpha/beta fold hydrolase n=1 Tax=Caballeronia sp. dw_276 TaxID=2719795 RepID=UPI001BD31818|nr:alpha/beta fold hydrolase [Caballeronia sp. dw_276]